MLYIAHGKCYNNRNMAERLDLRADMERRRAR